MARVRSYRRRHRPRRYKRSTRRFMGKSRRSSRKNRPSVSIQRGKLTSDAQFVKMSYSDVYTITTGSSVVTQLMRGNNLYDPDFTGAGHQPRGFDQYTPLYKQWVVYGSKIGCRFTTNGTFPINCVLLPRVIGPILPAKATAYAETKYGKLKTMVKQASSPTFLGGYMSTAKMFGRTPASITAEFIFHGDNASGPSAGGEWYWVAGVQAIDGVTVETVYVTLTITYYAKFFERIVPDES